MIKCNNIVATISPVAQRKGKSFRQLTPSPRVRTRSENFSPRGIPSLLSSQRFSTVRGIGWQLPNNSPMGEESFRERPARGVHSKKGASETTTTKTWATSVGYRELAWKLFTNAQIPTTPPRRIARARQAIPSGTSSVWETFPRRTEENPGFSPFPSPSLFLRRICDPLWLFCLIFFICIFTNKHLFSLSFNAKR